MIVPEAELLAAPGVTILLAEPGAGKTALLGSIADRVGAGRVRASAFRPRAHCAGATLVIDAFDEVARIGDAEPDRVLLSSRPGE